MNTPVQSKQAKPVRASSNDSSTTQPTITWVTPWYPINDTSLAQSLSSPTAYKAYLTELTYLGQAMQNLSPSSWSTEKSSDDEIVMTHTDQVGTFKMKGKPYSEGLPEAARRAGISPAPAPGDNYLYEIEFKGNQTDTKHSMSVYLTVASGATWTLGGIFQCLAKFMPQLLNSLVKSLSATLGNLLANAGTDAAEVAAEGAAEVSGVAIAEGLAIGLGVVGGVLALAAGLFELLSDSFQLNISIVNQSSTNYVILPNYYLQDGASELVAAANSVATCIPNGQFPPTICQGSSTLYPFSQCATAFDGTNVQASEYTLIYQHSGFSAPGVMLQLLEVTYDSDNQSWSPSQYNSGWTGLVVNPHYHTSDPPNIAMFSAGADLSQAESWWKQYCDVTPASTGSWVAANTTLTWSLAAGDPVQDPNAGNAWTWHIVITITDNPS
jgi:hypothetical protein